MTGPFSQVERTGLAWRRTALALGVVSLGGARILAGPWGDAALLPGAAGLLAALAIAVAADRRLRVQRRLLGPGDPPALPGGGVLAALAGTVSALGLVALAYALLR